MLNLGDRFLGEGQRLLTIISTNVDRSDLHRALVCPGRCLAELHFPSFTADETRAWLSARTITDHALSGPMSLADLYEVIDPMQVRAEVLASPAAGCA